jgi:iron complex transport system substrate-binding protein
VPLQSHRRSRRSPARILAIGVLTGALLGGCDAGNRGTHPASPATAPYPVTFTNCGGGTGTFNRAPTRVLSTAPNLTEDLLALGLTSRMIGDFGGELPVSGYIDQYHRVHNLPTNAFTTEELVGLQPDFVFAGWGYGFQSGTLLTPQSLAAKGIKSLVLSGSCANAPGSPGAVEGNDIESTYHDLRNLGDIFNIRQEAAKLIAQMQAQVASIQAKVAALKPVSVFLYNNGQDAPGTAAGLSTPNGLINLAGGTNIFAGLREDFTTVSWEQVVAADPQCIIIKNGSNAGNFGTREEQFLKTSPITHNLTAAKNNCFLILNQDQLTPGALNAQAVNAIARWLHPDAFGLTADRS